MLKKIPFKKVTIEKNCSIKNAMKGFNKIEYTFFIVLDKKKNVLGSITDGDIRRAILKGINVEESVIHCMNKKPILVREKDERNFSLILNKVKGYNKFLPVIDEKNKIKYVIVLDIPNNSNSTALIMAGGYGKRLGDKTKHTPKPLLKIGKKPILEILISKLENAGYKNIFISSYYLHSKIEKFIKKRKSFSNVKMLLEKKPLGTAGSIHLLRNENFNTLTVINGDIVTDINLEALLDFHNEKLNDITVSVADYSYSLPFGVVEFDKQYNFTVLEEKPTYNKFILSGIYCLNKSICELVKNEHTDMPDLITMSSKLRKKIGVFPIYEYWNDVGTATKLADEIKRFKKLKL